jgi:hypothetical protein
MDSSNSQYRPGICNIGVQEVRVRKIFLNIFLILTAILTITTVYWNNSVVIWSMLLFTTFSTIVLGLEIRYKFCIVFGFFNLHNFKQLGHLDEIHDTENAKADRARVLQIILQALAVALLYSSSVHFLCNWIYAG